MARTISRTVGRSAANQYDDVVTVQELLNQVPAGEGDPQPKLKVDGLCGSKTNTAIQKFQLHHFGWSGADGRVNPGHQTIAKLNEYDQRGKPVPPKFRGCHFTITRAYDGETLLRVPSYQWFFEVQDFPYRGEPPHLYYFGGNFGLVHPPDVMKGTPRRFRTNCPYGASELDCPASYKTYVHYYRGQHNQRYGEQRSHLELRLPSGRIQIPFDSHMAEPGSGGHRKAASHERQATFTLVRYYHRYWHP